MQNVPIFEQLQIEEALLRTDERSFCVINMGSPRAIVMGISGEASKLLDIPKVQEQNIPVIKRFSGGGTVVVDNTTLFVTFIIAKKDLPIPGYPEPILSWSADLYNEAWQIPDFRLKENDYCIGNRKCGGNAQYMRKDRWIHHTSFLWDYQKENMELLLLPPKRPAYRADRSHDDFLCRLKSYGSNVDIRIEELKNELAKRFYIRPFSLSNLEKKEHRQATTLIQLETI